MNQEIFQKFYAENYAPMLAFILPIVRNEEIAKDLVSERIYNLFGSSALMKDEKMLRNYLFISVRNAAFQYLQQNRNIKEIPVPEFIDTVDNLVDACENQRIIISELLRVLSPAEQKITYLRYIKGYTTTEIAKQLNRNNSSIVAQLSRARKKMKQHAHSTNLKRHLSHDFTPPTDSPSSFQKNVIPQVSIQLNEINGALIKYLGLHPHKMYDLDPRKFEELVAELLKDMGYEVQLTTYSKDGGRDILAIMTIPPNIKLLTIVECKRYNPDNPVGIEIVERFMYTLREYDKANAGLVATTSLFTACAKSVEERFKWLLKLEDFYNIKEWLGNYGQWNKSSGSSGLWLPNNPMA